MTRALAPRSVGFKKTFNTEVIVILEREIDLKPRLWDYKLLATSKTSTMQKEVLEAAAAGYQLSGSLRDRLSLVGVK